MCTIQRFYLRHSKGNRIHQDKIYVEDTKKTATSTKAHQVTVYVQREIAD